MSAKPVFHSRHLPSGILDQMHSRALFLPAAKSYTTEHTTWISHSPSKLQYPASRRACQLDFQILIFIVIEVHEMFKNTL